MDNFGGYVLAGRSRFHYLRVNRKGVGTAFSVPFGTPGHELGVLTRAAAHQ